MNQRYCALALITILFPTLIVAQEPDSSKAYELDPIVVTASQIEALRSTVPVAVSVLSKSELQQSGETSVLRVINEMVPGVFVTERGVLGYGVSNGAAGEITVRGVGGSPNTDVLVLTDGRPQMMGLMGHPLPDTYVNSGIERVEVIRGPASLMYGTNAMGGVINIIRERPAIDGASGSVGASYGSFGTEKYEGGVGYGSENAGLSATGNYYQTSGQRPYSSFKENNGGLNGWTRLGESFSLSADVNVSGFRTFDPGPVSAPAIDNWVDIARGSSGLAFADHFSNAEGAIKAFYNWGIHDIYDGFHSTDENIGVMAYQGLRLLSGNVTTLGVDFKRYGGKANSGPYNFGEYFINESGVYLLTQQEFAGMFNASAGVRLNHHVLYGNEVVPQFGLAVRLDEATTLKATVGKGFRSPTIRELYLFPAPTPTLQPERMWDYEVSVLRSLLDNRANIEVTGFISKGSNQIRVLGAYPNLTLANSGSFEHHGVEFAGNLQVIRQLLLDVTYSYLERGDQTAASPKHKVYVGGRYTLASVTFALGMQYVSGLFGDDDSREPLGDYFLLDARATVHLSGRVSLYIAGENLLNREYENLYQYPMPGRAGFVGLTWAAE